MNINWTLVPSPCFVLDESLLVRNLELLKKVQDEAGVSIICALKGFAFHEVFPLVARYLKGATASSLHEAKLVHEKMGVCPHTYCAAYVPDDFPEILSLSSHLTFNSLSEWERWKRTVVGSGEKVWCGLRVNPGYSEVGTDLYNPASPTSRLGIPRDHLGDALPEGITGIHFHALCENDSYTLERVLNVFEEKYGSLIRQAAWVNMGGGHLMTKAGYDTEHVIRLLKGFRERYPNLQEVILEPGSAVGWQTGYLSSTVLDIVDNGGMTTAMLDVSFTCHMPDCLEMPYKPKITGENPDGKYRYAMGGMSCLAGDFVDGFCFDEPLQVGQQLIFEDMIHYTMVKTTTFNGINLPSIGVWTQNGELRLLRYFGYNDYKSRLS
jgi:carboxynorspermidine decarboxylase